MTDENAATYNYGTNGISHFVLDIAPWVVFGTQAPGDNTTMTDRMRKMLTAVAVKPCVQDAACQDR